jgi:hypothetical protein
MSEENKPYVRMVIGECLSSDLVNEFCRVARYDLLPQLKTEVGFVGCNVLAESDGNMVILTTKWNTKHDCIRSHSSRSYRQFVQRTQHLLVGNFVIKLFQEEI